MTPARATAPATETLDRFAELAAELGADHSASEARRLGERLREQRFFVACLGQFKRGKSTLLNALVGAEVLPVGVPPVTTALTVLRYGTRARAQARLADGQTMEIALAEVASYVDERRNPENRRGVAVVEVFLPTPLLASGLCLVDTPGLGSVFAANAAVTRAFVPQVDAALIVLGTDPPITGEEADLVTGIVREVGDHVVIVLNKADRAVPEELEEARRFTCEVLEDRLERTIGPILEVSARERLSQAEATRDWRRLEERLATLAGESRAAILSDAQGRGLRRVGRALLAEVGEREAPLRRPLEASEARVAQLRAAVEGLGRSLADLSALLTSTEMELARTFDARREEFERRAQAEAAVELDQLFGPSRQSAGASLRQSALEHARAIAERRVNAFLLESEPVGEALYQRATERFVTLANDFLRQLAGDAGGDVFGVEPGFHQRRGFYFTSLMSRTRIGPFEWLLDRAGLARSRRVSRHARAYLRELVHTNAMRVSRPARAGPREPPPTGGGGAALPRRGAGLGAAGARLGARPARRRRGGSGGGARFPGQTENRDRGGSRAPARRGLRPRRQRATLTGSIEDRARARRDHRLLSSLLAADGERAHIVLGNHDRPLADDVPPRCRPEFEWLAAATAGIARDQLDDEEIEFLRGLQRMRGLILDGKRIVLLHATPANPLYTYLGPDRDRWRDAVSRMVADLLLVGHTHLAFAFHFGALQVVNPGSLGQPKDGDPRAAYAVIEDGVPRLERVSYDVERTVDALRGSGVDSAAVEVLAEILRSGRVGSGGMVG